MHCWVDSNVKLQKLCDQLSNCEELALDTEFIRTNTFYPKVALIQISDGQQCWLIDVLAVDEFSSLKFLLESPKSTIIFHACAEDLEVLDHSLDIQPTNIFDTQIAAGITNIGYCMGYARLVNVLFDIQLDKQETRSNWLARPLSNRQLVYAEIDVLYLHRLYKKLCKLLDDQQRCEWFEEEIENLFTLVDGRKNLRDYYLRVKGAWRLNLKSLNALNRLCNWRESMASNRDIPRSHIASDTVLLEIAKQLPSSRQQLFTIEGWYPKTVKRYAEAILKELGAASQDAQLMTIPQPLTKNMNAIMKKIRSSLVAIAEDKKIPQEFLCNKKELEGILRSSRQGCCLWPVRLTEGWRRLWVKPAIEAVLIKENLLRAS